MQNTHLESSITRTGNSNIHVKLISSCINQCYHCITHNTGKSQQVEAYPKQETDFFKDFNVHQRFKEPRRRNSLWLRWGTLAGLNKLAGREMPPRERARMGDSNVASVCYKMHFFVFLIWKKIQAIPFGRGWIVCEGAEILGQEAYVAVLEAGAQNNRCITIFVNLRLSLVSNQYMDYNNMV